MTVPVLISVVVLLFMPIPAQAKESLSKQIQDLVKRVDAQYARTKDLQADFVQETRIEGFDTALHSSGRVYIKKPGRLRWDFLKPSVEKIYVHGDQLEIYVPEHQQIIKGSLTRMVATKAPLLLLQGAGKLEEHFDVKPTGKGKTGAGGLPLLTLIPKQQGGQRSASPISRIVSEIQPKTYFIQTVQLHEVSGNVSIYQFKHFKANTGLDDKLFTLVPPEGVVVVDDVLPPQ